MRSSSGFSFGMSTDPKPSGSFNHEILWKWCAKISQESTKISQQISHTQAYKKKNRPWRRFYARLFQVLARQLNSLSSWRSMLTAFPSPYSPVRDICWVLEQLFRVVGPLGKSIRSRLFVGFFSDKFHFPMTRFFWDFCLQKFCSSSLPTIAKIAYKNFTKKSPEIPQKFHKSN